MKTSFFSCFIAACIPALLHGGEPLPNIVDLLKPHRVFKDLAVTTPVGIEQSMTAHGEIQLSGVLEGKSGTITLKPKDGHWDISQYSYFRVDITNSGDGLIWIRGRIENEGALDWKNSSSTMAYILPGERATVGFPFQRMDSADDSPKIFSMQDSRPNAFRHHWMPFEPKEVVACRLIIRSASEKLSLKDIQISVAQPYGKDANARLLELPYLDKFGQVRQLDWPNKLQTQAEFAARTAADEREARADSGPASFNRFGGWNAGPQLEATGFFRVEKYRGRWWFVDPDGRLFFSHGANSVGFSQRTPHQGRAALFQWMPSDKDLGEAISPSGIQFMIANQNRIFGTEWKMKSYDRVHSRLRRFGMNTVGAWSDKELYQNAKVPYTTILHVGRGAKPLGKGLPDPFCEEFAQRVEDGLRKLFPNGQDPWCIGVFIDNELGWHEDFVEYALAGDTEMPAHKAVFAFLKGKYTTIDQLNTAWATKYPSWEALDTFPESSEGFESDQKELKRLIAHRYYQVCHEMMRKVAPRHLYLGSRIHKAGPEVMAEAARFADVLSVNRYMPLPVTSLPKNFDKPCLVSEFHFGAPDRGVPGTGLTFVGDQLQRSRAYAAYVLDAILQPNIVGTHWFAYTDQSAAGRPGENYQIGFVDVTDTIYPEISETSRGVAEIMYSLANKESVDFLRILETTLCRQKTNVEAR
jgi:Beta-galactosidase